MFKLSTACSTLNQSKFKLSRNHAMKYMDTRNTNFSSKHKRSYLVLNEEQRKQGNKKEKLTESLH